MEVPGIITREGVKGRKMENVPKGYSALLRNYTGTYDLTAEAILKGSKDLAIQALLANPVVDKATSLRDMLDRVISAQSPWLDYLS